MLFNGNVYAQTNWTFPNLPQFSAGKFSTNSISLPNTLDMEVVRERLCAGHLEGDSSLHGKPRPALGAVPRLLRDPRLGLQLQLRQDNPRREEHAVCERASGTLRSRATPGFGQERHEDTRNCLLRAWPIAWDPKGDGKTSVRASFGISYDYVARRDDGELRRRSAVSAAPQSGPASSAIRTPPIPAATSSPTRSTKTRRL